MKRIFVCLVALGIAITVAHVRGGVAELSADELAARSASGLLSHLVDEPGGALGDIAAAVIAWFLKPGAYALSRIGVDPATDAGLVISGIGCWWLWVAAARLVWCCAIQIFGIGDLADYWVWTLLVAPWRPLYKGWLRLKAWYAPFFFHKGASAAWMGFLAALTLPFTPSDCVLLGRVLFLGIPLFFQVGIRGALHVMVVAATGAGKTRWLISWLCRLHKKASALVIDADAQVIDALGEALARDGHPVFNLDPYKLSRYPAANWNGIQELDRAAKRHGIKAVVRFARTLAEALVPIDNSLQPIFRQVAVDFVQACILYVWLFEPKESRNLIRVREIIATGMPELVIDPKQDSFAVALYTMRKCTAYDDGAGGAICAVIARGAAGMQSGQKGKDGNPFRTSALAATSFLDQPEIADCSRHSDFACEDLKTGNACVFVVAPVTDMRGQLSGWVRAITMMTWYAFANIKEEKDIPCAFVIDEAPSLKIPDLDVAAPVARKHGIRLVLIAQDVEKMREAYPHTYKGFWGNALCCIWMGSEHPESLELIEETTGTKTQKEKVEGGWFSSVPERYQTVDRPLIHAHQARLYMSPARGRFIVTVAAMPPIRVAAQYAENSAPLWKYRPSRKFGDRPLRALTRWVIEQVGRCKSTSKKNGVGGKHPGSDQDVQ